MSLQKNFPLKIEDWCLVTVKPSENYTTVLVDLNLLSSRRTREKRKKSQMFIIL